MKNFVKILGTGVLTVFLMCFTACTIEQEETGHIVDIVERSNLLDILEEDFVITGDMNRLLSQHGMDAAVKNLQLTSDYTAVFDLELSDSAGHSVSLTVPAYLSYERETVSGKDSFKNVRLYWGDVTDSGENIFVTATDRIIHISPDITAESIEFSAVTVDEGYILAAATAENECTGIVYHTNSGDGLAVFDKKGNITENTVLPEENHLALRPENSMLPFDADRRPSISFCNGDDLIVTGDGTAFFYNTGEDVLLYADSILSAAEKNGIKAGVYAMKPDESSRGKAPDDLYMAVRYEGRDITGIIFEDDLLGRSMHEKQLVISHNTPTLKCDSVGVEIDFDFDSGKISRIRHRLPREMLGERLYVSKDRQYRLYSFSPEEHKGVTAFNFALKEAATGKTGYLGCGGLINGSYPGETGFIDEDELYILGDNDFRIYDTDVDNTVPVFALSAFIPLGEDINENFEDRILVAAVRGSDEIIAVYYDTCYENGDEIYLDESHERLKAEYQIAVFDTDGNLKNTYDTGISALTGYCPVTVYHKGNQISLYVTYKDTGKVLLRGTLNITSGEFAVSQEYTPYTA